MKRKPLFKSINKTDIEEPQVIHLGYDMAHEMKILLDSIVRNVNLVNDTISKGEPHIFEHKKVLTFNNPEHEALCEMLNTLKVVSTQGTKTVDDILLLFGEYLDTLSV